VAGVPCAALAAPRPVRRASLVTSDMPPRAALNADPLAVAARRLPGRGCPGALPLPETLAFTRVPKSAPAVGGHRWSGTIFEQPGAASRPGPAMPRVVHRPLGGKVPRRQPPTSMRPATTSPAGVHRVSRHEIWRAGSGANNPPGNASTRRSAEGPMLAGIFPDRDAHPAPCRRRFSPSRTDEWTEARPL